MCTGRGVLWSEYLHPPPPLQPPQLSPPPKSICWNPNASCGGFRRWGLWEILNHEGGALMIGISALTNGNMFCFVLFLIVFTLRLSKMGFPGCPTKNSFPWACISGVISKFWQLQLHLLLIYCSYQLNTYLCPQPNALHFMYILSKLSSNSVGQILFLFHTGKKRSWKVKGSHPVKKQQNQDLNRSGLLNSP